MLCALTRIASFVLSLESPQRGDSDEYTQQTIINIKKKITLKYLQYNNVYSYGSFCLGLENEFEIGVVNEPSVFEPLKIYCSLDFLFLLVQVPALSYQNFKLGDRKLQLKH